MSSASLLKDGMASGDDLICAPVVDVLGRHHANAAVAVFGVVAIEERPGERSTIFE